MTYIYIIEILNCFRCVDFVVKFVKPVHFFYLNFHKDL